MAHCGKSNMAAFGKEGSMANLFEQQDNERLLEINLYVSGETRYKGREGSALSMLNKFRLEGEAGFCDVILEVEGRQLTTHRCVLAANSQFFYTMFSSGMKESSEKHLSLQSVCFTSMSLILDYFYTREIVIDEENVLDLLDASSFLLVSPVKNACIQLLSKRLSGDNCFSIKQIAEQFGADELAKRANDFIKSNFAVVVNNEEFVSISQKDLMKFLASDDIQVEREEEVYQAVLKWAKHDVASRSPVLPELLKHLRQGSLPKGFLGSELGKEPLLVSCSSCAELVRHTAKKVHRKRGSKFSKAVKASPPQLRSSTVMHNLLVGIGTGDCRKAFCYDMDNKEVLLLPELSLLQYHPQVAIVGRILYLVGGHKYNNEAVRRVTSICFDGGKSLGPSTVVRPLEWKTKTSFEDPRLKASLAVLKGLLYLIGGWDVFNGCTDTVECYNPEVDRWEFCARLNTSRCKSGCAMSKEHIFIIGGGTSFGLYRESMLTSVERYDPERNAWSFVAPLKEARLCPGCIYWNSKIYVIGGISVSGSQTSTCEVYSTRTDEWHSIASLPYPCCGVNNVIIVRNQVTIPVKSESTGYSCEGLKYSIRSNVWQKVKKLGPSDRIGSFSLCTLQLPMLVLKRMPKEYFPEDFFELYNSEDEEMFLESASESESFLGWDSLNDSEDFDDEYGDIFF